MCTILCFSYTYQIVGHFLKVASQCDNNALSIFAVTLDEIGNTGAILDVESSIDLVHDVEGTGFQLVQGEDECEWGEGLLAAGQVADFVPGLVRRAREEAQPRLLRVSFRLDAQFSHPASRQLWLDSFYWLIDALLSFHKVLVSHIFQWK